MSGGPLPWWDSGVHADRRPLLLARTRIVAGLRRWLAAEGFLEVEPAILQRSPGNETHLHAFATRMRAADGADAGAMWLHTSPELAMKKLLAAGETRIAAFARVFRDRERGPLHHPEFTMLEWYRAEAPLARLVGDCEALVAIAAEAAGTRQLVHGPHRADPFLPFDRLTIAEAFERFAGIDLLATLDHIGEGDTAALAAQAQAGGIRTAPDDDWADIFSRVLVARIEPRLGHGRPTVLIDYPASQAALARPKPGNPRVAERFELYACGIELANAFGELTDPIEQRRRLELEMAAKQRLYGERYPIDEDFLAALAQMPPSSGIALGLDRLVMLATGAPRIEQVIWTPVAKGCGHVDGA